MPDRSTSKLNKFEVMVEDEAMTKAHGRLIMKCRCCSFMEMPSCLCPVCLKNREEHKEKCLMAWWTDSEEKNG